MIILIVIGACVLFHTGHGAASVRHGRARGLAPSVCWRSGMGGPWVSVRGPAGSGSVTGCKQQAPLTPFPVCPGRPQCHDQRPWPPRSPPVPGSKETDP